MIERNDHEAMAANALRLLADQELAARIAHNARDHCRKFSWPAVQQEWLKLYHEVASNAPVREPQPYTEGNPHSSAVRAE
jgi:glycosyltransferase involved in cell wall biosynthesis